MRPGLLSPIKRLSRLTGAVFARLAASRQGNFGLMFALVSMPILLGVGISIDYVRAYNTKIKMQGDLDAALIAAVKKVDSLDESQIKTEVGKWFSAQTNDNQASYKLLVDTMVISKTNRTINAVATGTVPTTFLGIANIKSVNVSVTTSVAGPATSFLNVYIVLDKSPSMLLAATTSGQTTMKSSQAGCVFACHDVEGGPWTYSGHSYTTNYSLAKAMGVQLRADVSVTAASEVLDMIEEANNSVSHVKVGLYKLGTTTSEVLAPTASISTARTKLTTDSYGLTSATSETATYFDKSLSALQTFVGVAGDGSNASNPLKLVLLLTDGVQSERNWVLWWNKPTYDVLNWGDSQSDSTKQQIWKVTTPLNPGWCSGIKNNKATMAVLYTKYLPITGDWGYESTVGEKMSTSKFTTIWGGTIRSGVSSSTTRQAYIPYALEDCASSKDLFLSASDPNEIEAGLSSLFQQYLGSVRLTQ